MRSSGAVALLIGARCFLEAAAFTGIAAIAHASTQGRDPMPVFPTLFGLFGAGLLLVTLLREIGSERRSALLLVVTLAAGVAWGLRLPMRDPDGFSTLSRIMFFGLLAEAFLWRTVTIARGALRWFDARNAVPFTAFALAAGATFPGPVDHAPFAAIALVAVAAAGLALSLGRSIEELALARGATGSMRTTSSTSATAVVGVLAVAAAIFVPYVQDGFVALGQIVAPVASRIFFLLILPFAYLAGIIVEFLRQFLHPKVPDQPGAAQTPNPQDELLRQQIEAARPFVFGGVELLIIAVGVLIAIVLFDRMLRERRTQLPEGATLEREPVEGMGLRAALGALRPSRRPRGRGPRDDGTPAGALRALYWRFLVLAERRGIGWRHESDTPAEHWSRAASSDARWRDAAPLVHAYEDLRYGEIAPAQETVARASEALRSLEQSTSPS